jgi:hypothetical protein
MNAKVWLEYMKGGYHVEDLVLDERSELNCILEQEYLRMCTSSRYGQVSGSFEHGSGLCQLCDCHLLERKLIMELVRIGKGEGGYFEVNGRKHFANIICS